MPKRKKHRYTTPHNHCFAIFAVQLQHLARSFPTSLVFGLRLSPEVYLRSWSEFGKSSLLDLLRLGVCRLRDPVLDDSLNDRFFS